MREFLTYVIIFQIVTDIYDAAIGSALVFGALKWRKGLLTITAFYWGIVLGLLGGIILNEIVDTSPIMILFMMAIGAIVFPILTYTTEIVNRFVLGYIVIMKLLYLYTTYMFKEDNMEIETAIMLPIVVGTVAGIVLMFIKNLSVLPFVLGCAFIGASQIAPTIAKYVNQIFFGMTHDYSLLFDPIDFIFAVLFKIELTDGWTLLFMIVIMCIGVYVQLKSVKNQGYSYNTPIIVFETDDPNMHGKIIS